MVGTIKPSANGVSPFTIERRRAVLVFEQPEYQGIHIETRLDVDLKTFLELQMLAGSEDSAPSDLREAFILFGEQILESWNLQDEDGTPLSPDAEGFLTLPPILSTAILGAWSEAATTSGEVSASE
jgi:hypothetical protein